MSTVIADVTFNANLDGSGIPRQASRLARQIEQAGTRGGRDFDRNFNAGLDDALRHSEKKFANWNPFKKLDNDVQLVIGAIIAAADQIATLGSAAGAGLAAVGGLAVAAGVGVIGLATVFTKLNEEIDKAPIALQGAIKELDSLQAAISEIGDVVTKSFVASMGGGFKQLEENVRGLTPALGGVGDMLGHLVDDFGKVTVKGSKAFGVLNDAIVNGTSNFDSLARSSGTFGEALLRIFNRAQPLVEDLLGWIDDLADSLNSWSQSTAFDDWISNAQSVFGALGPLIDSVGRALNDLVTPASVQRTVEFIDNLTDFIPSLTTLLDTMGGFDAFGLAAGALAEFGEALEPLAQPLGELAIVLNEVLGVAIGEFARAAGGLATTIAPLATAVANFLGAMPESSIKAIAGAIVILGAAFATLNVTTAIGLATSAFQRFTTAAGQMSTMAGIATRGVGRLVGALARAGGVAVGVGVLANSLTALAGGGAKAAPGINAITAALDRGQGLDGAFRNASAGADTLSKSLQLVEGSSFDSNMERIGETLGGVFGVQGIVTEARSGIAGLDAALAGLVSSGNADQAAANFKNIEKAAKEQGIPVEKLALLFPQYEDALAGASNASDDAKEGFEGVGEGADTAIRSIKDLSDAIRGFGDTQLSVNDAQREFQSSLQDAKDSFAEFGATMDITTEGGRANSAALDGIAQAAIEAAAATKDNTGSQELANAELEKGRAALVEQAKQFGYTQEQADEYATKVLGAAGADAELTNKAQQTHRDLVNQLEQFGLTGADAEIYAGKIEAIPSDAQTQIAMLGAAQATGDAEAVKAAIDKIPLTKVTNYRFITHYETTGQASVIRPGIPQDAAGGIATRPRLSIWGEAGPEALVPLNRPLNMVDPAVRELSAFAQGKQIPRMGAGGIAAPASTNSRVVNIQPGAIVVQGNMAPEATATMTVNRIAERISA